MKIHPLAEAWPKIEGKEFDEIVRSIKRIGLREPIVMHEGAILDGVNRYRACLEAGFDEADIPTIEYRGDDAFDFVHAKNAARRHLTPGQRAIAMEKMLNVKLDTLRNYTNPGAEHDFVATEGGVKNQTMDRCVKLHTDQERADSIDVSRETLSDAKVVVNEGTADEVEAAKAGDVSVSAIAKKVRARRNSTSSPAKDPGFSVAIGKRLLQRIAKKGDIARDKDARELKRLLHHAPCITGEQENKILDQLEHQLESAAERFHGLADEIKTARATRAGPETERVPVDGPAATV